MLSVDATRATIWQAAQFFVTAVDSNPLITQVNDFAVRGCIFQIPLLEQNMGQLSGSIGFPVDQLKCIFGLLVTYPLSMIFVRLPPGSVRHAFSLFFGLFLMQCMEDVMDARCHHRLARAPFRPRTRCPSG